MPYKNREDLIAYRKAHRAEARERSRLWRLANPGKNAQKAAECRRAKPEQYAARKKAYVEKNREAIQARNREWRLRTNYATSPARLAQNKKDWLAKYGITPAGFDELLASQDGVCRICASPDPKMKRAKRLYVDHCHLTGKIRGLLCFKCNTMLGNAEDQPERLRAAAEYLEAHRDSGPVR